MLVRDVGGDGVPPGAVLHVGADRFEVELAADGVDEAIAYLHDRQGLQKFVGRSPWDHRPLSAELARQVGAESGEPDAVPAFDPSAFAKKGDRSVGVLRQLCGRLMYPGSQRPAW